MTAVAERTREVRAEVAERRAVTAAVAPLPVADRFELAADEPRKPKASDVERWLREGTAAIYGPKFIVPRWTVKQNALAKRLLDDYGAELVKKAVDHYCQTWQDRVKQSRGRITGAPTISLLWAMREVVFAEAQVGPKVEPRNTDEYRKDDSPDSGW